MSTEPATAPDADETGESLTAGQPLLQRVRDFVLGYPHRPDAPEGQTTASEPG